MASTLATLAYRFSWVWLWNQKKRREFKRLLRKSGTLKSRNRNYTIPTHFSGRFINHGQLGHDIILHELKKNTPCLVTRFGATEFKTIKYFYINKNKPKVSFSDGYKADIKYASGFFSPSDELLTKFCCDSLQLLKNVDIFVPWCYTMSKKYNENEIFGSHNNTAKLVHADTFGQGLFAVERPYTQYLEGKKVLVCHPFERTIQEQYKKREKLFKNPLILPEFELKTLKVVQGLGDSQEVLQYGNWFEALESMYRKIDDTDFDIALIAGGAYGMFLANYIKERGKQAVHVAGALQLLFGIKGARWGETEFMNEHWVSPSDEEKPKKLDDYLAIEGTPAYW